MWNKPEDCPTSEIHKLSEPEADALAHETIAADLERAIDRVQSLMVPELFFHDPRSDKRVIDLRRRYDLHYEYESAAPRSMAWSCIDLNSYEPAPDAEGVSTYIGRGSTRREAALALLEQFGEFEGAAK